MAERIFKDEREIIVESERESLKDRDWRDAAIGNPLVWVFVGIAMALIAASIFAIVVGS